MLEVIKNNQMISKIKKLILEKSTEELLNYTYTIMIKNNNLMCCVVVFFFLIEFLKIFMRASKGFTL